MRQDPLSQRIDWLSILLFLALVLAGWINVFAADYDPSLDQSMFSTSSSAGKQMLWILTAFVIAVSLFLLDIKFFESSSYIIYGVLLLLLIGLLFAGKEVAGSKSWVGLGAFGLQPSEFAKFATALALARFLNAQDHRLDDLKTLAKTLVIILVPASLIMLQGDTGTAMVFVALLIPLFREGLTPIPFVIGFILIVLFLLTLLVSQTILLVMVGVLVLLALGMNAKKPRRLVVILLVGLAVVGTIRSVDFVLSEVLKPHQQKRVLSLVNPNVDPLGAGWNVTQSKIAIGSGGFFGKGFLKGTQTKFDFVPAQTTDFIFCTIGEEYGLVGSSLLITLFAALLLRLVHLAERQKSTFARVYGYSFMSILFFHFAVNIAMTIGLFPVIGIPLPFVSYGGSSLWAFTILLFSFLNMDAQRTQILQRR